jgi:hypothetical protein
MDQESHLEEYHGAHPTEDDVDAAMMDCDDDIILDCMEDEGVEIPDC